MKIRKSIFETNSSSSHSITLCSDGNLNDTIIPDDDGVIRLEGGRFGWEWEKYTDALTKANYCAQDHANNKQFLMDLVEVIMEQTGADQVIIDDLENGYIDHQSQGTAPCTKQEMKDFIFNPESKLWTGNDNDEEPEGWGE